MTNPQFIERIANFFQGCVGLMEVKNPDYAHQGVPLFDMFHTAYQERVPPETVLRVLLTKHWSAITAWSSGKSLSSETIDGRLQDAANYIGMLAMLSREEGPALVGAIIDHLQKELGIWPAPTAADEDKLAFLEWMQRFRAYTYGRTVYDARR